MRGRKILLVGRFFGDGPARFSEFVVPPLGGRIDAFCSRLSAAGETVDRRQSRGAGGFIGYSSVKSVVKNSGS